MKRQATILIFILTFCLVSCVQPKTDPSTNEKQATIYEIDTSVIAILPLDTTQYWILNDQKLTSLTSDDLQKIEKILNNCISEFNLRQEKHFEELNAKHSDHKLDRRNFIIELERYKRQYIATINSMGEKEVWVNCFCKTWEKDWKTSLVVVKDGGNCYFNLKINLTTGENYELMVNGDA